MAEVWAPSGTSAPRGGARTDRQDDLRNDEPLPQRGIWRTGATGLEPATSGVTGRRSNRLSYAPRDAGDSMARVGRATPIEWRGVPAGMAAPMYIGLGTLILIIILLIILL